MKKSEELFQKIESNIGRKVRVHFNSNTKIPQFGQFVHLSDASFLRSKGYARFVSESKLDAFNSAADGRKPSFTRLLIVSDFLLIKIF